MILIFEFFSGKHDILSIVSVFNLPQVYALMLAIWSGFHLFKLFGEDSGETDTHIEA